MTNTKKGVSPVICIIVMVAITFTLVSIFAVATLEYRDDVYESSTSESAVSATLNYDGEEDEVVAEVRSNRNTQRVFLRIDGLGVEQDIVTGEEGKNIVYDASGDSGSYTAEIVFVTGYTGTELILDQIYFTTS